MNAWQRVLFPALWLGWALCWWALSRNVKPTLRTESFGSRLLHILPLVLAGLLLWLPELPVRALDARFMPDAAWVFWAGAVLALVGLGFTVWARLHLGRNWSGIVTVKQGHELVTSGPYAFVRHPIYSGLLLAFAGSALARGEWRGIVAVALVLASLWRKLRMEERWMREQFADAYVHYARRVAALVPHLL
jgi:protein-S-isoprenylcysteine O-methyltransferase Ste14